MLERLWPSPQACRPMRLFPCTHFPIRIVQTTTAGVGTGQDSNTFPSGLNVLQIGDVDGMQDSAVLDSLLERAINSELEELLGPHIITHKPCDLNHFLHVQMGIIVPALPITQGCCGAQGRSHPCEALYNLWNANKDKDILGSVAVGTETNPRRIQQSCLGDLALKQHCAARTMKHSLSHLSSCLGIIFRCCRWAGHR